MPTTELLPNLHLLTPGGWQVYVWRDEDGVTLIDAGAVGSGPELRASLAELGLRTADVDRLVLTHFHDDHAGGAAEVAGWGNVEVLAHAQDAPIIRGAQAGPPPNLTAAERELHARVAHGLQPAPPCRVDRELVDGEALDIAGGALVVATPGHTDGSMALLLQRPRVLFTGDTVAEHHGQIMLGPFNLDRDRADVPLDTRPMPSWAGGSTCGPAGGSGGRLRPGDARVGCGPGRRHGGARPRRR